MEEPQARRSFTHALQEDDLEPERSIALVTPTYRPDLVRCELLAESVDRCVPHIPHYLIVDRCDLAAFSHLAGPNRHIVESETLLEGILFKLPWITGMWFGFQTGVVRGWIVQQILKIASPAAVREQTLIFCDSDTAFIRRFDRDDILVEGQVGLLDVEFVNEDIRRWQDTAIRLIGSQSSDLPYRGHVGNMICWDRDVLVALQKRLSDVAGRDWRKALAQEHSFSEYMLYGVFVRALMTYPKTPHLPSDVPLVKASWGMNLAGGSEIDAFFADFDPRSVAVMVHSKDGIDPAIFRHHLERFWNQL